MKKYIAEALNQAYKSLSEGGIPIGSVLAIGDQLISSGHNQRVQKGSCILHAEMDFLERAGRLTAKDYGNATLYTTLSPCYMCSGAIMLYGIRRVVIGDNINFKGAEDLLMSHGVEIINLNDKDCIKVMGDFIRSNPELWHEDIGV